MSAPNRLERWIVWPLLGVWCAHLLAYVWLTPPWQHYDEPTHFEYAALIRELGRLPTADERIPALRRAIAESMIAAGFYDNRAVPLVRPNLDSPDLSLGFNERTHPPLYYAFVALATAPLRAAPITTQLYAARLCSLVLALLLFVVAYAALRLITGDDWQTRCMVLAVLALNPAFADNMSAVNNDALANLVAVLVLLAAGWYIRHPTWTRLLVSLAILILAVNSKRTLLFYGLLIPMAWLLGLPRSPRRWLLVAGGVGAVCLLAWLAIHPWMLADWDSIPSGSSGYVSARVLQRLQPSDQPSGARTIEPYTGAVAFALERQAGGSGPMLVQEIDPLQRRAAAGKTLMLSAWMRADRENLHALTPAIQVGHEVISRSLSLGTSWRTITLTANVPPGTSYLAVRLFRPLEPGVVFYDSLGLTLDMSIPARDKVDGSFEAGVLGPEAPRNLLRNAGAERQIPQLPDTLWRLIGPSPGEDSFRRTLSKLFDPAWIAAVYPQQALRLFEGAWGIFGWGEISVNPGWFAPLGLLVLISLAGCARYTWRAYWQRRGQLQAWPGHAWWLCLIAVALGWGAAMLRVHSQPIPGAFVWSFGRYTFVAIVPSLLLFTVGVRELLPAPLRGQGSAGVVCFLLLFALAALFGTLIPYWRSFDYFATGQATRISGLHDRHMDMRGLSIPEGTRAGRAPMIEYNSTRHV
jgi:Predicted membrane protein (DUF2142)